MDKKSNSTAVPEISILGATHDRMIPAAGEAMPNTQELSARSAVEVALLDLEAQICDLYAMVQISASLFESQIGQYFRSEKLQSISSYEMDMVAFATHDLVRRASSLRDDFYAAALGEDA